MVDYGQHTVIASALWEAHDQVHGYLGEQQGIDGDRYLEQGCMGFVCKVLVLLADHAPFHVLLDPLARPWPVEALQYLPDSLVPPWVARQSIMVNVHYSLFEFVAG